MVPRCPPACPLLLPRVQRAGNVASMVLTPCWSAGPATHGQHFPMAWRSAPPAAAPARPTAAATARQAVQRRVCSLCVSSTAPTRELGRTMPGQLAAKAFGTRPPAGPTQIHPQGAPGHDLRRSRIHAPAGQPAGRHSDTSARAARFLEASQEAQSRVVSRPAQALALGRGSHFQLTAHAALLPRVRRWLGHRRRPGGMLHDRFQPVWVRLRRSHSRQLTARDRGASVRPRVRRVAVVIKRRHRTSTGELPAVHRPCGGLLAWAGCPVRTC